MERYRNTSEEMNEGGVLHMDGWINRWCDRSYPPRFYIFNKILKTAVWGSWRFCISEQSMTVHLRSPFCPTVLSVSSKFWMWNKELNILRLCQEKDIFLFYFPFLMMLWCWCYLFCVNLYENSSNSVSG